MPKMCARSAGRCCIGCLIYSAVLLFIIAVFLFVIVPVIFMFSVGVQRNLVFPTYIIEPKNYSNPEEYKITGVRNFYVDIPDVNVTLGVWQILPKEIVSDIVSNDEYNYEGVLKSETKPVLLYLHGNGSDRTQSVPLYNILREFFHIFAVDYRGYADSTPGDLTETTVVDDISYFFKWLKKHTEAKIFVWGHSLGTGVATSLLARLKREDLSAAGVILEAPFTSVVDVMKSHPVIKFYSFLPWCQATLLDPIKTNDLNFDSKDHILNVDCPIMILHAEDDDIIPYSIATELYFIAANNRNGTYQGKVTYHLYEPKGHGHMFIYLEDNLPEQVKIFIEECLDFGKKKL